ncbi:MAG: aquaporin [Rhodospirillales bacterium]
MMVHVKPAAAELIGTFVIVFAGSGAIMADVMSGGALGTVGVGLAFGLAFGVMILVFGPVSGAHFNPAISLVMLAVRGLPVRTMLIYVTAQILGALIAAFLLRELLGTVAMIGTPMPNRQIAAVAGIAPNLMILILEFIFTALVAGVVLSVTGDTHIRGPLAAVAVGAAIMLAMLVVGPLSGAGLNPARYLGPAAASGSLDFFLAYISAPIAGAFAGALLYRLVIDRRGV